MLTNARCSALTASRYAQTLLGPLRVSATLDSSFLAPTMPLAMVSGKLKEGGDWGRLGEGDGNFDKRL